MPRASALEQESFDEPIRTYSELLADKLGKRAPFCLHRSASSDKGAQHLADTLGLMKSTGHRAAFKVIREKHGKFKCGQVNRSSQDGRQPDRQTASQPAGSAAPQLLRRDQSQQEKLTNLGPDLARLLRSPDKFSTDTLTCIRSVSECERGGLDEPIESACL